MGMDEAWFTDALRGILSEQTLQLLHYHILHPSGTLRTLYAHTLFGMQRLAQLLQPVISPLAARASGALQDSPDLVFLGILLAVLFVALQILAWVQRTIAFFTRLAFRAVLFALVGLAIMAAWQRGPEAVAADVVAVVRELVGYAGMVRDVWLSEYQKYDAQTRAGAGSSAGLGQKRRL